MSYVPRGECTNRMIPSNPRGCNPGYEPYVYRSKKMLEGGDTFDPCCKPTGCALGDEECIKKVNNRWTARVVRFADTAHFLTNRLTEDLTKFEAFTTENEKQLTDVFKQNPELHESAVKQISELNHIAEVIQRDLDRCVKAMTVVVDNTAVVPKAAVMKPGFEFDVMRAESVGSGCASLESLLAIARSEYFPRYMRLAQLLNDALAGYDRTHLVRKYREAKYATSRLWLSALSRIKELAVYARQLNVRTLIFWLMTGFPFLYTSVLTIGTAVPAILMAKDQFNMMVRSFKLFCNFTQLPGLVIGLGVLLTNKLHLYFMNRQNKQRIDDQISKGAVTFFSIVEKFVVRNPAAAASISAIGAMQAGADVAAFTAKMAAQTVASLSNKSDNVVFLVQAMQNIILFFMTIISSTIWKAIGFACKTTAQVTAPLVEGTTNVVSGASTFIGGVGHLVSETFGLVGSAAGWGLTKGGEGLHILGDKVAQFSSFLSGDNELRQKLAAADVDIDDKLVSLNEAINRILGTTVESVYNATTDVLHYAFQKDTVRKIESLLREFAPEIGIVLTVMAVGYGTLTFFQPLDDPEAGLNTAMESGPEVDWLSRNPTEYIKKYGRIIPRPPADFVYEQCLREDFSRDALCRQRVQDWTGQDYSPPRQYEANSARRRRGSSRRRKSGRR